MLGSLRREVFIKRSLQTKWLRFLTQFGTAKESALPRSGIVARSHQDENSHGSYPRGHVFEPRSDWMDDGNVRVSSKNGRHSMLHCASDSGSSSCGGEPDESHERACKPGSVANAREHARRRSSICARRLLAASTAIYPNVQRDGPPRVDEPRRAADSILFDLAPDGVYQAKRVTPSAGALLPHRFSLATHPTTHRSVRSDRSAVYSLLHFP